MKRVICPECGNEIEVTNGKCPNCGYPLKEEKESEGLKSESVIVDPENAVPENPETEGPESENNVTEENLEQQAVKDFAKQQDQEKIPDSAAGDEESAGKKAADSDKKKKLGILCGAGVVLVIVVILTVALTKDLRAYLSAKSKLEQGNYVEAIEAFEELGDYKDSSQLLKKSYYENGLLLTKEGDYGRAKMYFAKIYNYPGVVEAKNKCWYLEGSELEEDNDYEGAYKKYNNIQGKYKDSKEKVIKMKYLLAKEYMEKNRINDAIKFLEKLQYEDSEELLKECRYRMGKAFYDNGNYEQALENLQELNYKDSNELVESMLQSPFSLQGFVNRYNEMVDMLAAEGNAELPKISSETFTGPKVKLGSGAELSLNNTENGEGYIFSINNFSYSITITSKTDSRVATGEMFCVLAGIQPNYTRENVGNIINDLMGGNGRVTQDGITYVNYSMSGVITLKATVD